MSQEFVRPSGSEWWQALDDRPESLDLSGLGLQNADLKKLKQAQFLRRLNLGDNPLLDNKAVKLLAPLQHLETLDLSGCSGISGGLRPLGELPLKSLRLTGLSGLTAAGLKPLTQLAELEELSLAGCGATDGTAKLVAKLTGLRHLDLSWDLPVIFARGGHGASANLPFSRGIQSSGLYKLRTLKNLKHLALRHQFLQNLVGRASKLEALESLDLSYCYADPEGGPEPFDRLKNLRRVTAKGASGVATAGLFASLPKMKTLEYLDLEQADIHASMMRFFFQAQSLRWLRLPSHVPIETVTELRATLSQCEIVFEQPLGYVCLKLDESLRQTGLCAAHRWLVKPPGKEELVTLRVDTRQLELVRRLDRGGSQQAEIEPERVYDNEAEALVNPIDLAPFFPQPEQP